MGTYNGGTAFAGTGFDGDILISQLTNDLPVAYSSANYTSSLLSMASSSYATMRTLTVAVAADELCLFITRATISCGTALDAAAMQHRVNGTDLNEFAVMQDIPQGSTNGQQQTFTIISGSQDLPAGNINFDLRWARVAGSGTIYSLHQYLRLVRLKRR